MIIYDKILGRLRQTDQSQFLQQTSNPEIFDDFIGGSANGAYGWAFNTNGAGSNVAPAGSFPSNIYPSGAFASGVVSVNCGTTSTGRATLSSYNNLLYFSLGYTVLETGISVPVLSTGAEEYVGYIGFGDSSGPGDQTDGVYFKYDRTTSANWIISTAAGGVRTTQTTSTAVDTGFNKLKVIVNAAGTSATFYVNGTQVGTPITTNIPVTSANATGVLYKIEKTVGTTSRVLNIDYIYYNNQLTTPR